MRHAISPVPIDLIGLIALLSTLWTTGVAAQDAAAPEPGFELFPVRHFYKPYIADPMEPKFGLTVLGVTDSNVVGSGDTRSRLELGGTFPVARWSTEARPEGAWQISISAGFYGQFDVTESLDNIGWDGIYGLYLTGYLRDDLVLKVGNHHDSSHVGDELLERTGRTRIGYTREEWLAGLSWQVTEPLRLYGEVAYDLTPKEDVGQEPGRIQLGVEIERPRVFRTRRTERPGGGRVGWYAAANVGAFEERDWQPDTSVQVGFLIPTEADYRRWRFGLGVHDGRVPLGEFSFQDETWVVLGLWLDL